MTKIVSLKRMVRVSVASVAMAAFGTAVGVGSVAMMSAPAYAQTSLTADQVVAIQTALNSALANVNSQGLSGSALTSALQSAIAQVESSQVAALGASAAGAVTSAVLQDAANANVPPSVVGAGLGQASVTIASAQGTTAANAVGTTIANEGSSSIINSFTSTASSLGAPPSVVASANSSPTPTGATGNGGGGSTTVASNSGLTSGGGGGSPGCTNPSCK